jgi:hypothetical protein
LSHAFFVVSNLHFQPCLLAWSQNPGCHLEVVAQTIVPVRAKRNLIPLLTFLFVVCYSMMTYLVFEQAKTIENQRNLIHTLFGDSLELTSIKGKEVQERNAARAKAQAQAPAATPKDPAQDQKKAAPDSKTRKHSYPKPPQAASDAPDVRRALKTI